VQVDPTWGSGDPHFGAPLAPKCWHHITILSQGERKASGPNGAVGRPTFGDPPAQNFIASYSQVFIYYG